MQSNSIINTFKKLPANARYNIALIPLFSIPNNLVASYASLYIMNQGVLPSQVGVINSISFIIKALIAIIAGRVVNRLGRKFCTSILDIVAWSFPMLLFALSHSYWQFMVATMINSITIINTISNQFFFIEDVDPSVRIHAFNFCGIASASCGFFVPITGILISHFGLVSAIRGLYFFAFICMSLAAIGKLIFLKETSIGIKMKKQSRTDKFSFKNLVKPARYVMGNRRLIILFSLSILTNFTLIINNLFYFPYLTKFLHFSNSIVSIFPFISTGISLAIYVLIVPRVKNKTRCIRISLFLYSLGAALLIFAPLIGIWLGTIAGVVCWASAGATISPVLNTMIANTVGNSQRAEVMGFFNLITTLCMFPAGYIGGVLYQFSPVYPVYFILSVYLISLLIFIFGGKVISDKAIRTSRLIR